MKKSNITCDKCGTDKDVVHVSCGDMFLGYLCGQHGLKFTMELIKLQEAYFQKSIEEYKNFIHSGKE